MATIKTEITTYGPTPTRIRSALVELIRGLFASASVIRDPNLKGFVWTADPKTSKISINSATHFNLQNSGLRAAVVVARSSTQFAGFMQGSDFISKVGDGTALRSFLAVSDLEIRCIGQEENIAEMVAAEVGVRLREVAKAIADDYAFKKMIVGGIGVVAENDGEWIAPVPVRIVVEHASTLDIDALPARLAEDYDL